MYLECSSLYVGGAFDAHAIQSREQLSGSSNLREALPRKKVDVAACSLWLRKLPGLPLFLLLTHTPLLLTHRRLLCCAELLRRAWLCTKRLLLTLRLPQASGTVSQLAEGLSTELLRLYSG